VRLFSQAFKRLLLTTALQQPPSSRPVRPVLRSSGLQLGANLAPSRAVLTTISSTFSSAQHSSHLGTSYLLAHSAFTPLYGRLSTLLGRRGANQFALSLLFLGTLGCGFAPSMAWLVAARFVAGCGGGGLSTTASVISSDLYGLRERSLMQGVATLFSGLGTGLGGPFGGWVSDRWGWGAAFLGESGGRGVRR